MSNNQNTFSITDASFDIERDNEDKTGHWMLFNYHDPVFAGTSAKMYSIVCFKKQLYGSWMGACMKLQDVLKSSANTTENHYYWKVVKCPAGLIHTASSKDEGRFDFCEEEKACSCPTKTLMLSGCVCGGL